MVGIDSSEEMINLALHTFPQGAYPNLSFQRMDVRKLTFQAKFDRLFSNAALHWIIDHKSVLHGVQRSMKNGGRLLFQMGGKGNAQENKEGLAPRFVESSPQIRTYGAMIENLIRPQRGMGYVPQGERVYLCDGLFRPSYAG